MQCWRRSGDFTAERPQSASLAKRPQSASLAKRPQPASLAKRPQPASLAKRPQPASLAKRPQSASLAKRPQSACHRIQITMPPLNDIDSKAEPQADFSFAFVENGTHPISYQRYLRSNWSEKIASGFHHLEKARYLSDIRNSQKTAPRYSDDAVKKLIFFRFTDATVPETDKVFVNWLRGLPFKGFFNACRAGPRLLRNPLREDKELVEVIDDFFSVDCAEVTGANYDAIAKFFKPTSNQRLLNQWSECKSQISFLVMILIHNLRCCQTRCRQRYS
jgi:hypothetical protein